MHNVLSKKYTVHAGSTATPLLVLVSSKPCPVAPAQNPMSSFGLGQQQSSGADIAAHQQPVDSSTPWVAAADGNLPLLQHALRQLNLPITATDENGYTLLQAAASYSQIPIVIWILEQAQLSTEQRNALVNAVDNDGDSALHYASTASVAQFLVERVGIDTQLVNTSGCTALQSKSVELAELLQDEDTEDDDVDVIHLKETIAYLESVSYSTDKVE